MSEDIQYFREKEFDRRIDQTQNSDLWSEKSHPLSSNKSQGYNALPSKSRLSSIMNFSKINRGAMSEYSDSLFKGKAKSEVSNNTSAKNNLPKGDSKKNKKISSRRPQRRIPMPGKTSVKRKRK